ncbi:MAG: hypothetical protein V8R30_04500 [Clostridia bacterium]|nr:hypothetical protein [Clostridia bacterium]CDE82602.1 unknown [Clostridium sp. CAG:273]
MFFVINKNKMYTYIVTICMVIVLFVLSFAMITNSDDTVVTSTNSISNNTINNESSRLVTKKDAENNNQNY